jgi:hypothetical protein
MNTTTPIAKRIGKIALIALCAILAFVLLVLLLAPVVTTIIFHDFFKDAEKEFRIPGQADGMVSQGFTYLHEQKSYLQCGYMADGVSASRIYIIPEFEPEKTYYVELYTDDGTPYTGHTGGISVSGDFVFLANDGEGDANRVWVLSIYYLLASENGSRYTMTTYFHPETRAAYCYVDGDYLWVGEFHRPVDYPTKESHTFSVSGDVEHHALICAYPLDDTSATGIKAGVPALLLSVTGQVQGMVRTEDGGFILSTSYGLSKSHLIFYKNILANQESADNALEIDGTNVPVWYLDANHLIRDLEAPPMSEEMVVRDGRVYYLTESACKKYIFGNFIRGRHVYSLPIEP